MYDKDLQEVFGKLKIFEKMYEIIRFIDPVRKKVINYKNNVMTEMETKCFDVWDRSKICDNCISIRVADSNMEDFIEGADKKLYTAKYNGRNRVEW